jgi:putative FmdB family regulatory protein
MPIYEYKCLNCGKPFEKLFLKKEEETKVKCPYCGSQNIKKIISGFYANKRTPFGSSSCGGRGFGFT